MIKSDTLTFVQSSNSELSWIINILKENNLCVDDLPAENIKLKLVKSEEDLLGVYGIELYEKSGILRSVAVVEGYKGEGIGTLIMNQVEKDAAELGIIDLYLLTISADKFFERFGFRRIPRETADSVVTQSYEFMNFCPDSAVIMLKKYNYEF